MSKEQTPIMKVRCTLALNSHGLLTYGKVYEVIKSVRDSYVIKRDDGSIDKVSKSRFEIVKSI